MENTENIEIGKTVIKYNQDGTVRRASFIPQLKIEAPPDLKLKMKHGSKEEIKDNADMVMAAWFNKVNDIELSDRELYEIKSEIVKCELWEPGKVKTCIIKYSFIKK
jgi:hypothetical protein